MIATCENEIRADRRGNASRPLTHSLDCAEEGIAMQATRACSVTECNRPHYALDLCHMHYQRVQRTGVTDRPLPPAGCLIADCGGEHFGRGWCQRHYYRWRRTGDPLAILRKPGGPPCSIDGCSGRARARGWCGTHYTRWRQTGDPLKTLPRVYTPPGETHPSWQGSAISYASAHRRITNAKGRAADHACADCGRTAAEWSYDYADPDELVRPGRRPHPFSVKPEHYQPRCVRCHRAADIARRRSTA